MKKIQRENGKYIVDKIIVHHSAGSNGDIENCIKTINRIHQKFKTQGQKTSLGYDIAYHYVIDSFGSYKKTRELSDIGFQAGNWKVNCTSIGICLDGNFQNYQPSDEQIEALKILLKRLKKDFGISNVKGHRDIKATACPGNYLYNYLPNLQNMSKKIKPLLKFENDMIKSMIQHKKAEWNELKKIYTETEVPEEYQISGLSCLESIANYLREYPGYDEKK